MTLLEKPWTIASVFDSFNWGIGTVLARGGSDYVTSPGGRAISWLLILFGVAMLGMITGALVAMVIDFLLEGGPGVGCIRVPGPHHRVRLELDRARPRSPSCAATTTRPRSSSSPTSTRTRPGEGVYFVRGDPTDADDLERAGIHEAAAALIFPVDASDAADMQSILTIMAIESIAPAGPDGRRGQQPAP